MSDSWLQLLNWILDSPAMFDSCACVWILRDLFVESDSCGFRAIAHVRNINRTFFVVFFSESLTFLTSATNKWSTKKTTTMATARMALYRLAAHTKRLPSVQTLRLSTSMAKDEGVFVSQTKTETANKVDAGETVASRYPLSFFRSRVAFLVFLNNHCWIHANIITHTLLNRYASKEEGSHECLWRCWRWWNGTRGNVCRCRRFVRTQQTRMGWTKTRRKISRTDSLWRLGTKGTLFGLLKYGRTMTPVCDCMLSFSSFYLDRWYIGLKDSWSTLIYKKIFEWGWYIVAFVRLTSELYVSLKLSSAERLAHRVI